MALHTTKWRILFWLSYTTFLISRLVQKYKNIFVRFLVQMKSLKFTSEIYWPLCRQHYYCPNVYTVALLLSINGLFSNWCWLSTRVMWCDIFPMYLFFHHYYSQKGSISHPSKKKTKKSNLIAIKSWLDWLLYLIQNFGILSQSFQHILNIITRNIPYVFSYLFDIQRYFKTFELSF